MQGQPSAGVQTISNCAVDWTYFRVMVEITGHLRDALKSSWVDAVDAEFVKGKQDLIDLMTTTFMGSTAGLELAVDYGSAYAGVTRNGSAGWFEATETAVSGSLAFTDLIDLQETIRDNDKGSKFESSGLILCPLNQQSNIYNLSGGPAVQYIGDADKAPGFYRQHFMGKPIVALPDWTNTVIMFLDNSPGKIVTVEHRPFSVKEMGPSGDSDLYQLSWAGQIIDHSPKLDGKLTGVTA